MSVLDKLYEQILNGKRSEVENSVHQALSEGHQAMEIIEKTLRPAMGEVGELFSTGEFFLPDLVLAASAMKNAMNLLRPLLTENGASRQEVVVIGTVFGDLHDIGKNLVIATLEGSGFKVVDLGIDVPANKFVTAIQEHKPVVLGISSLLSTTMKNIPTVLQAINKAGLRDGLLIAVGGAPVTKRNADEWGVEIYAPDAGTAARIINEAVDRQKNLILP
jgi:5-methyltetrahydrofolate--homocysteine methyltransferase